MRLTWLLWLTVREGRTSIVGPRHLPYALRALNPLYAQAFSEGASLEIGYELFDSAKKDSLLGAV